MAVDLDGDGTLEVIVGAGVQRSRGWVYALDSRDGGVRWRSRFKEELYATPTLVELNGDGVPDIAIGGRDADATALNGRDGGVLWRLRAANPTLKVGRTNFNGAAPVGDRDGDGVVDLAFTQGGTYDDTARKPGAFYLVSGATGRALHAMQTPDAREIYSVPAATPGVSGDVIIGTGGETLPGTLYRVDLSTGAQRWAVPVPKKGVVASPLVARLDAEGPSVVAALYDGRVARFDLETGAERWSYARPGHELRASPAPGRFGGTGALDVVVSGSRGVFPEYHGQCFVAWLDGATGALLDQQAAGVFSAASPVVADVDGDGFDETFYLAADSLSAFTHTMRSTLWVYDGRPGKALRLTLKLTGAGMATPLVADLEGDGQLDLVIALDGRLDRYALSLPPGTRPTIRWGAFRGPNGDGLAK